MDRIRIRGLHLRTVIGVHEWERHARQDVLLDLDVEADLSRAAETDDIRDALDYRALTKRVIEHVESSRYRLLEALADSVARMVLETAPMAQAVRVTVDKPGALRFARSVAVEVSRRRP
jgi:FolB domain-containing protein